MTKYQAQVFMKESKALWRFIPASIASPADPFCYGNNVCEYYFWKETIIKLLFCVSCAGTKAKCKTAQLS